MISFNSLFRWFRFDSLQAGSLKRVDTGIRQRNTPVVFFGVIVDGNRLLRGKFDGKIAIQNVIVQEVFFNYFSLVAKAEHEIIETVMRVNFHHVPQNRFIADGHHRLGLKTSLFFQPGAQTAAQDNYLGF